MDVLLVDPWGTNNTAEYLNGLILGVSNSVSLTVATNYYFKQTTDSKCSIERLFFKKSEKMKAGLLRKIVRGLEYYLGYKKTMRLIKRKKFEIIHFNWLLNYKQDYHFLRRIKSKFHCKLVYTAHNVQPHNNGEKYKEILGRIYGLVDTIVLHGNSTKDEFVSLYPHLKHKIYVQRHGCNIEPKISFNINLIEQQIVDRIKRFDKVFIFFGLVFFNKGIDRLASFWINNNPNALLILSGKQVADYPEYDCLKAKLHKMENVLILDGFVDDNTLNYLITNSDLVLMPYRHASMSGVVFTAADFSKTLLTTNVGSIPEYLENGIDSIVVGNDDSQFCKKLSELLSYDNKFFCSLGYMLHENIYRKYNWKAIGLDLINYVYLAKKS